MYRIIVYKRHYDKFFKKLSEGEKRKFMDVLMVVSSGRRFPPQSIKYLRDGIYEFRVAFKGSALRLFFIYDGVNIIVLLNGFKKKTQKTPQREIEKAIKLKEAYYVEKAERTVVL